MAYIENEKIKQIMDKYIYDRKIKIYSNKYFSKNKNDIFREIKSKEDVNFYNNNVVESINIRKDMDRDVYEQDIIIIEENIGKYEIAVHKVLQCYAIKDLGFDYTEEEINQLINNIFKYYKLLDEIRMRFLCQD